MIMSWDHMAILLICSIITIGTNLGHYSSCRYCGWPEWMIWFICDCRLWYKRSWINQMWMIMLMMIYCGRWWPFVVNWSNYHDWRLIWFIPRYIWMWWSTLIFFFFCYSLIRIKVSTMMMMLMMMMRFRCRDGEWWKPTNIGESAIEEWTQRWLFGKWLEAILVVYARWWTGERERERERERAHDETCSVEVIETGVNDQWRGRERETLD